MPIYLALVTLALLVGCMSSSPASDSTPIGTITVAWDVAAKASFSDSSHTLRLTPLTYTDLDHIAGGTRYLTATFRVENLGAEPLENLTLRAYAHGGTLGGTAVGDVRGFPTPENPNGPAITDPRVAQSIRPLHGTQLGSSGPEPDPHASDFQAFSQTESQALDPSAQAKGLLGGGEAVLDYGFVVNPRKLEPAAAGMVNVAVRLPRTFEGSPKPYRFKLSFVVTTSKTLRVSQALGETAAQALGRAEAMLSQGQPIQLVLLRDPPPAQGEPGLSLIRLSNLRIGLAPTFLLE